MSTEAILWALAQPVEKSSAKFVLVAMASCVNGQGAAGMVCWPSTAHLCDTTSQDRKTAMNGVKRLLEAGYIVDTGDRKGGTGQIPVYRLKTPENGTLISSAIECQAGPTLQGKSTENGTVNRDVTTSNDPENETVKESPKRDSTENGTVPFFPPNSTAFPTKESRFSPLRVPKTGHGTRKEQVIELGMNKEEVGGDSPPGFIRFWNAWPKSDRKEAKGKCLQAWKKEKAEPLADLIVTHVERKKQTESWTKNAGQFIEAPLVYLNQRRWEGADLTSPQSKAAPRASRHSGFDQLDYSEGLNPDGSFSA